MMAEDRFDGLAPCPWCGGGEFRRKNVCADSPKMGGQPSLLITVELTHWCAKQDGLLRRTVQMAGKTADAVVAAWNRRAGAAETDALRAALAFYADEESYDWTSRGGVPVQNDRGKRARTALAAVPESRGAGAGG